ncbi:YrbL family protein [Halomonas sp. GT]|uniref:YrbL family protein n=1 Tax=Halomonas sp. GT TaxID=1971364 RepID=UPI0009F2582F|nr:YrbL family protein [Halomonas sp. GT]
MYFSYKKIAKEINNSEQIILHDDDILSYGSNRICYLYKEHPSKLIKISRDSNHWKKGHRQSLSEWYVSQKIKKMCKSSHISFCHTWVTTNRGPGLVVDKIFDDKGKSLTLRKLLFRKELTVDKALILVEDIIRSFFNSGIPASDFNIDNFILNGNHNEYKLIMVDGFSPKKLNFKTYLLLKSKRLSGFYTHRKWQQAKSQFTKCAQEVYAGNYRYAAAPPLHATSKASSDNSRG